MQLQETMVKADDGVELFVRVLQPLSESTNRTLLLVHGMAEHGQRYLPAARLIVARGWNVLVPDLRGHGRSGGAPVHVSHFSEYVADLKQIAESTGLHSQQTALLGHSMGGLISARFAERFPDSVAALVMLSPLLGVKVAISPFTLALGRLLSYVRPQSRFDKRIPPGLTTRNPEALARVMTDPLIHHSVTAAWYFAMQNALQKAWSLAGKIACPLLIMQAGCDLVVDPQAPQRWMRKVASLDKTLRVLPEHYHELLSEVDWPNTLADVMDWLEQRVANGNSSPAINCSPSTVPEIA